ncbi:MAG: T9SS type A sorting domain-containing protein [Bacteroidia bacterium]|nr:T9SS type A sorting domain-containing protein [Bacteroidia bacterium]
MNTCKKKVDTSWVNKNNQAADIKFNAQQGAQLYQNIPNPFNVSTSIEFDIPTTCTQAYIYIYNYQGEQLKAYRIDSRNHGSIQLRANELKAGVYFYSLITDGKEVATKKMILTK